MPPEMYIVLMFYIGAHVWAGSFYWTTVRETPSGLPTVSESMAEFPARWMDITVAASIARAAISHAVAVEFLRRARPRPAYLQAATATMLSLTAATMSATVLPAIVWFDCEKHQVEHFGLVAIYLIATSSSRYFGYQAFLANYPMHNDIRGNLLDWMLFTEPLAPFLGGIVFVLHLLAAQTLGTMVAVAEIILAILDFIFIVLFATLVP